MVIRKVFFANIFTNCTFCGIINTLRKLNIFQIGYFPHQGDTIPFWGYTTFEFGKNANSIR